MRRLAIACGVLLLISAAVAAFAQGQGDGVTLSQTPPAPAPWALKPGQKITPTSTSVTITDSEGFCSNPAGVEVQRTDDSVVITTLFTAPGGSDGTYVFAVACPTPAPTDREVDLGGALGNRVILDGSSTPAVQRYPAAPVAKPASIFDAYARLHGRGLPVTFDRAFPLDSESRYTTSVARTAKIGRRGHRALLAAITAAVPGRTAYGPLGSADPVPDFRGRALGAAVTWADARTIRWSAGTPPRVVRSRRATLAANYIIKRQVPAPGRPLSAGGATPLTLTVRTR